LQRAAQSERSAAEPRASLPSARAERTSGANTVSYGNLNNVFIDGDYVFEASHFGSEAGDMNSAEAVVIAVPIATELGSATEAGDVSEVAYGVPIVEAEAVDSVSQSMSNLRVGSNSSNTRGNRGVAHTYNSIVDTDPSSTWTSSSILRGDNLETRFNSPTQNSCTTAGTIRDNTGRNPMRRISYQIGSDRFMIKIVAISESLLSQESSRTALGFHAALIPVNTALPSIELSISESNAGMEYSISVAQGESYEMEGSVECNGAECGHVSSLNPDVPTNPFTAVTAQTTPGTVKLVLTTPFQMEIEIGLRSD